MSLWHLLWIIPLAAFGGHMLIEFVATNSRCERESSIYHEGYTDGVNNTLKLNGLLEHPTEKLNKKIKIALEQELDVPDLDDMELDKYLMKRFGGRDYIYSTDLDKSLF